MAESRAAGGEDRIAGGGGGGVFEGGPPRKRGFGGRDVVAEDWLIVFGAGADAAALEGAFFAGGIDVDGSETLGGVGGSFGATAGVLTLGGASESRSSTASKAELSRVKSSGGLEGVVSPTVGRSDLDPRASLQLGGGLTITMPPHLGQARIWPIAAWSRTRRRDLQVVQVMAKRSILQTVTSWPRRALGA